MIPRAAVIRALRDFGYRFDHPTDRTEVYHKAGATPVYLPRRASHSESWCRETFEKIGMTSANIGTFITQNKPSTAH